MNAPHPLHHRLTAATSVPMAPVDDDDEVNFAEYWDIVVDNRWLLATVTAICLAVGTAYAVLARPLYEANLLIQVEDSAASAKSFLGEAASLFDVKTPATAEMEIIRSRMVIGQAVEKTLLYIDSKPRYLPLVGHWLSRKAKNLSAPWLGWVSGTERIVVSYFAVPSAFEGSRFRVTAGESSQYSLSHPDLDRPIQGKVGDTLIAAVPSGTITLNIASLDGKPGAEFNLIRYSELDVIERLQKRLKLAEKGRQSGIIDVSLQDNDRAQLSLVLNEIGQQYVRQNVTRKAAEAQKTLEFLSVQLPQFKKQLDQSEEAYSRYRNQKGTVALDEEAKLILGQSVDLETKLVEAQQKRREMITRFTPEHPAIKILDDQIAAWQREIGSLTSRVKGLPSVQQEALRLERDVKVNNELYQQLRNNTLQLQLIREGKVGNVRLIDSAAVPREPVKPQSATVLIIALISGLFGGVMLAFARNSFSRGLASAEEIEARTGMNVFCTVPLSETERVLANRAANKVEGIHLLTVSAPQDPAVESLRSLRTAIQFSMLDAASNRVLITGPTPGVGKSFLSANFAAVVASMGKRVLLIDADLRKGHLHQYFGIDRRNGLSDVVAGLMNADSAIRRSVIENLDLLPTGTLPPNPAELIASAAFSVFLDSVSGRYDLVLIDSAPVLVAADTLSIASLGATVMMVARADETQMGELHESKRRLLSGGGTVSGVVLNAVDLRRRHYGSYVYKYGGYRYRDYSYGPSKAD